LHEKIFHPSAYYKFKLRAHAQTPIELYSDSIKIDKVDTVKAYHLYLLSYYYQNYKPDSALLLAQEAYTLSKKLKFLRGEIGSLGQIALAYNKLGSFRST